MRREVRADVPLRLVAVDLRRLRQSKGGDAVEDGVVRALGDRALQRRHRLRRDLEHFGRGARVDIFSSAERLDDRLLARGVREDAQLDLRVIRRDEAPPFLGDERGANAPAELRADRDVHEVWVLRAQPARRGHELVERRVDPAGARVHEQRKGIRVRALQLRETPVLEDLRGQLVPEAELGEHVGVGRIPGLRAADRRQLQLLEQDVRELLRRRDRELFARELVDLAGEVVEAALELLGEGLQPRGIDTDAVALHEREHLDERPLDVVVDRAQAALAELRRRVVPVARDPLRALGEHAVQMIVGRRVRCGQRRRTLDEDFRADLVELVRRARGVVQVGRERAVVDARDRQALAERPLHDRFRVVHDERPLEQRGQRRERDRRGAGRLRKRRHAAEHDVGGPEIAGPVERERVAR